MKHKSILECVPNFSEGRDKFVIDQIAAEIQKVKDVKLMHIDMGAAANRTVVTFAGEPGAVIEAAFLAIKKAAELIDMRKHRGVHLRMGATDVCPLIPIKGITIEDAVKLSHQLAERVGNELNIPVYLYEASVKIENRSNLSLIRKGEYEGMSEKMLMDEWKPDFGPAGFNKKSGATAIGVRDFLIAYNVNLDTTSAEIAGKIAGIVRETGFSNHNFGKLKSVKAIGWYIEEYKKAQVSMNITDINTTPVHIAFDTVTLLAKELGVKVTGSEIVGMLPLKVLTDAAKHYCKINKIAQPDSEKELIKIAVEYLGLNDVKKFIPKEKVIEYVLGIRKC